MQIELTNTEISAIVKKSMQIQIESIVEDQIDDAVQDEDVQNVVKEVLIDYIKSPEGRELLKKSFIERYAQDGDWLEYDNIAEAVDKEVANVIKKMFKDVKIQF